LRSVEKISVVTVVDVDSSLMTAVFGTKKLKPLDITIMRLQNEDKPAAPITNR
jgi:hypothetical protein